MINRDPAAIRELQHQYAGQPPNAGAADTPQIQLAVAKMLDSSRHREALGNRHLMVLEPVEPEPYQEKLSALPH